MSPGVIDPGRACARGGGGAGAAAARFPPKDATTQIRREAGLDLTSDSRFADMAGVCWLAQITSGRD